MMDKQLLQEIREAAAVEGKEQPILAKLPDKDLAFLFSQVKNGAGNRAIARALRGRLSLTGSENSLAQSIGKFRARVGYLFKQRSNSDLPSRLRKLCKEVAENSEEDLELIEQIEKDYGNLINERIAEAREQGTLPMDLHKHVQSLATLRKTRQRLEKEAKDSFLIPPRDAEFEKRANAVHDAFVGSDGEKMIRAANLFLEKAQKFCVTMEFDPKTGEYKPETEGKRKRTEVGVLQRLAVAK